MKRNRSNKAKVRRARSKQVLAILLNRLETLELLREEIHHPAIGDFAEDPLELAVVRWNGLEVYVPLDCVVFLGDQPYAKGGIEWGQKYLESTGRCAEPNKRKNT